MKSAPENYKAYDGDFYRIEFYYDEEGYSQAREYMTESLTADDVRKFAQLLVMIGDLGQIRNKEKFRNEGDKIYAFKPHPHRFLCFFGEGGRIIITNGFTRKQQKLPISEKDRALKCREDYQNRMKNRTYYGKEG